MAGPKESPGQIGWTSKGIDTLCNQLVKYQRKKPATQLAGGSTPQTHSSDSAISGQQPTGRSFGTPGGSPSPQWT